MTAGRCTPAEFRARSFVVWVGVLALLVIVGTGCEHDPVSTTVTNNASVPVSLLFEHDGCKVFRFEDGGRNRYFVKCPCGSATVGQFTERRGKTTHTVDDDVATSGGSP